MTTDIKHGGRLRQLFAGLLLDRLFGLLLLGLEEGTEPFENVGAQDQRSCDDSLATSHNALPATLLVFVIVGAQRPVLGGVGGLNRPVEIAPEGALDVFCLGLDNGHLLVDFGEQLVTELIGFGDIGLCVGGGSLEVRQGRFDEFGVASVGQLNGLDTIRILLDGLDGVGNERV